MKPGVKTSEFWVGLAAVAAALFLRAFNKIDDTVFSTVLASSSVGYSLSRGLAKFGVGAAATKVGS